MRRFTAVPMTAILTVVGAMIAASAEAGPIFLQVTLDPDNAAACTVTDPLATNNSASVSGTCNGVGYNINAQSNNPGTPVSAYLNQFTLSLTTPTTSGAFVEIFVQQDSFAEPTGPGNLFGSLTVNGTGLTGATYSSSYNGGIGFVPLACTSTPCVQGGSVPVTLTPAFNLASVLRFTLGSSASIQASGITQVVAPDGGTAITLLGCALLGIAAMRRRLSK